MVEGNAGGREFGDESFDGECAIKTIPNASLMPDAGPPARRRRSQKNTTPGGSQAFRVPSVRDHETGHAAHEPLSSSKMPAKVLEEVPLTGLSFEQS